MTLYLRFHAQEKRVPFERHIHWVDAPPRSEMWILFFPYIIHVYTSLGSLVLFLSQKLREIHIFV